MTLSPDESLEGVDGGGSFLRSMPSCDERCGRDDPPAKCARRSVRIGCKRFVLEVVFALLVAGALCAYGIHEKRANDRNLAGIPLRINVNGIRGKSTVTRLITSILAQDGHATVGKTTGTAARLLYPDGTEVPIKRKPEGANIKEQIACIRKAVAYGADSMVFECMALKPEYQELVQNDMVKAQIYVVVNVLEDHLDVMGPTTEDIAKVFANSIPWDGITITMPGPHIEVFDRVCRRRRCKLIVADESDVHDDFLGRFSYELFPANAAIAYEVAKVLGISRSVAEQGMLAANPDPGALRFVKVATPPIMFVNGFAANEPASSIAIWKRMEAKGLTKGQTVVLFNGRPDRVDRTDQFINDFFPWLPPGTVLIGMGQGLKRLRRAYEKGHLSNLGRYIDMEGKKASRVMDLLSSPRFHGAVVLGVGNIHGDAIDLIDLMNCGEETMPGLEHQDFHGLIGLLKGRAWFRRS